MADAFELEQRLRAALATCIGLLARCAPEDGTPETADYQATLEVAARAIERARSALTVRLVERQLESETERYRSGRLQRQSQRERELEVTVEFLAEAIRQFRGSSASFADDVVARSDRMTNILAATDLQALRRQLGTELDSLRTATVTRRETYERQFRLLRKRVRELEARLSEAASLASRDSLTGLYNRRAWNQRMAEPPAASPDTRYVVALIDLDEFKAINDHHGHAAGDEVLMEFGQLCRQSFGEDDFVARYGGDEFAALIAAPSLEHSTEHLERLMDGVRRTATVKGGCPPFTITVGAVAVETGDLRDAVREADAALYAAKQSGRDRLLFQNAPTGVRV